MVYRLALHYGRQYPFIWSFLLIPCILIMVLYPSWKVVIFTAVIYLFFVLIIEFNQESFSVFSMDFIALFLGMLVNLCIHFTNGYFRIKSKVLLRKVEEMTITDSLTGLYNRRYFDIYIDKAIPLSKKTNFPLLHVMIDIDYFKKINDTYGHLCGDYALQHVASVILKNIRDSDVFIRMGGEEFAILFPETTLDEGKNISERIRKAVENSEFIYSGVKIPITISLGLSIHTTERIEEFIQMSDAALYMAKTKGSNQLVVTGEY
jgi:diguanylate cyclase (GGDEF)-like protein